MISPQISIKKQKIPHVFDALSKTEILKCCYITLRKRVLMKTLAHNFVYFHREKRLHDKLAMCIIIWWKSLHFSSIYQFCKNNRAKRLKTTWQLFFAKIIKLLIKNNQNKTLYFFAKNNYFFASMRGKYHKYLSRRLYIYISFSLASELLRGQLN